MHGRRAKIVGGVTRVGLALGLLIGSMATAMADNSGNFIGAPQAPTTGGLSLQNIDTETGTFSSNSLLSTHGASELIGSTTSPEFILKDTSSASQFSFDTRVDENIFNQSEFNSTDAHENANISLQNQNWLLGSQFRVDYDTTRTSELADYNLNDIVSRHLGLLAAPSITYAPDALDAFSMTGSLQSSHYDNTAFTNYAIYAATPAYAHHFDPLNTGTISLQAQSYQTTSGTPIKVDTIGPTFGWQTILTPRLTANASIGAESIRQYDQSIPTGPWTWQYTFAAGLAFKGEQDTVNFTGTRAQFPYAIGAEALQTSFAATETHDLNSLVSLNIGANYLFSTYQLTPFGGIDTLTGGSAGATYHIMEDIDLSATYQYRYETLTGMSATAEDNTFLLTLAYHPKEWTLAH